MKYKTPQRNTPVVTLIRNYTDKKSGKVADSRKEIQRRFDYLDWKDQKKILMAFLDSGKTDRQWAYLKLLDNWDPSFEPKVRELWETLREPQCSWSVIRFFPISYVVDHMASFTGKRDYFFICRRLAEDPDYVIERSRLSAIDYLSVVFHSGRSLTADEANSILFEIVHDLCVGGFDINDLDRVDYANEMFSPSDFRSISLAKYYLREMNHVQAEWLFDEWNKKVRQSILQSPEYQALLKSNGSEYYYLELKISIVRKYAYQALDDRYKQPTDTGMSNLPMPQFFPSLDSMRLEDMVETNPALKELIDTFGLEVKGKS